jgi:hypothetical protein
MLYLHAASIFPGSCGLHEEGHPWARLTPEPPNQWRYRNVFKNKVGSFGSGSGFDVGVFCGTNIAHTRR